MSWAVTDYEVKQQPEIDQRPNAHLIEASSRYARLLPAHCHAEGHQGETCMLTTEQVGVQSAKASVEETPLRQRHQNPWLDCTEWGVDV